MNTQIETTCRDCGHELTDHDICWQQWNTRRTRLLSFCEPCFFQKRTPWRERIWSGLFDAPYGEWPIANPSTDP
jgi:hypothetical protein